MAQKIEYTEQDFIFIKKNLEAIGFRQINHPNFKKNFERLGIAAPRNITGREEGFEWTENMFTIKIWTTYITKDKKFRDTGTDMGWVLILQGDMAQYFAKPIKRTKDFVVNLLSKAWITQWRVKNRPLCKQCDAYMQIQHNDNNGAYFWGCQKIEKHSTTQPQYLGWDSIGSQGKLPQRAKQYVDRMRAGVAKYKEKNKKKGIERTPARKIRKNWEITKPENKVIVK